VNRLVQPLAHVFEGSECFKATFDFLDPESVKVPALSAAVQNLILILDPSAKKDAVDVVLD
jgi:hypothetical protein